MNYSVNYSTQTIDMECSVESDMCITFLAVIDRAEQQ